MPTSQYKQLQYTWTLNGTMDHSFLHSPATKPSHKCSESKPCTGTSKFCGDSLYSRDRWKIRLLLSY